MVTEGLRIMKKIAAHLFQVEDKCYVYDANKNNILHVPQTLYSEIAKLISMGAEEYFSSNHNEDIAVLRNKGYFFPSNIKKIEFLNDSIIRCNCEQNVQRLILQVTQNCNFKCRYCTYAGADFYDRTHTNNSMTWETARKAIDFFKKHSICSNELEISFYGGEPLLQFPIIKKSIQYAEEKIVLTAIRYKIITNATLLNNDIIQYCVEHKVYLYISMDGPQHLHDKVRRYRASGRGSFEDVLKKVVDLRENFSEYFSQFVFFQPVIVNKNMESYVFEFFKNELGVSEKHIIPISLSLDGLDWMPSSPSFSIYKEDSEDEYGEKYTYDLYNDIYNDKSLLSENFHHNGPCIAGSKKLFVTYDGNFLPCEKISERASNYIGNLQEGFNYEKIRSFCNIGELTKKECLNCWAVRFCSMCICDVEDSSVEQMRKNKLNYCLYEKKRIKDYFKFIVNFKK